MKERKKPESVDVFAFFGEYFKKKYEDRKDYKKLVYIMNRVDYFEEDLSKIKFVRRS